MIDQVDLSTKLQEFLKKSVLLEEDWKNLNDFVTQIHVPENKIIETRPFELEDFASITFITKQCFNILESLFSNQIKLDFDDKYCRECLNCIYSIILLCGEHSSQNLWTNDECIDLSNKILKKVLKVLKCQNLISFLMQVDDKRKFHGTNIFNLMIPKLTIDKWRFYPSLVQSYSWLLHFISIPNMKEYINLTLPVSLIILSDYTIESKIIGLECLHHIISNVSKAELHWHIQIEVLHKVLKPLFYYREWDLIVPLIKCTLEVIEKTKPGFKDSGIDLQWSYLDDVLNIFLPMMEFEQDILRRQAYSKSLYLILNSSNFAIGRWSERLLRIIRDYTKMPDTELEAVKTLNSYIRICWPLVKNHRRLITVIAGRIVYRSMNKEAIAESEIILQMLNEFIPNESDYIDIEYIKQRKEKNELQKNDS